MSTQDHRYQKQQLFSPIGETGQERLSRSTVLLIGCGALGCVTADILTRAGIGCLKIVDRDFVELTNLQRQILYTEDDVRQHLPKAVAARNRLASVNSTIEIHSTVADVTCRNIEQLSADCDLILDGTDNFEIRYLINDVSLQSGIPWIFTGCTGSDGQMMPIIPGYTGCLRCLLPDAPPPGTMATCDTAGVLGPAVMTIASLQAATALKILVRDPDWASDEELLTSLRKLTIIDAWNTNLRTVSTAGFAAASLCPACHNGERLWLRGEVSSKTTVLCGRNAVQVSPPGPLSVSLPEIAGRLQPSAKVLTTPFLVRAQLNDQDIQITVFPDGRAIIKGTEDPTIARAIYNRWVGG